ncbi:hypothetical protein JX266_001002 [Neoarthrinium moseri]|uniref:uncharacterized protein n=1 Tax=Neoarthrinium moseri TaxID=1658444 RepID=UPI001FDDD9B4|nr:uncharacterized protein JN550_000337 [Neoarthrinium moseri]KAI1854884.1 hypothetical protein JX266_001002 [Neoarthrinium moseri]KAI1878155.1 hypothetical protein JN550_000337 [Neoarthrinium moseri]
MQTVGNENREAFSKVIFHAKAIDANIDNRHIRLFPAWHRQPEHSHILGREVVSSADDDVRPLRTIVDDGAVELPPNPHPDMAKQKFSCQLQVSIPDRRIPALVPSLVLFSRRASVREFGTGIIKMEGV